MDDKIHVHSTKECIYDIVTGTNGIAIGANTADEKCLLVAIVRADTLTINIIAEGGVNVAEALATKRGL